MKVTEERVKDDSESDSHGLPREGSEIIDYRRLSVILIFINSTGLLLNLRLSKALKCGSTSIHKIRNFDYDS